jgi:hypothetical protein
LEIVEPIFDENIDRTLGGTWLAEPCKPWNSHLVISQRVARIAHEFPLA